MGLRRIGLIVVLVALVGTACGGDDDSHGDAAIALDDPIGGSSRSGQAGGGAGGSRDPSVAKSAFAAMHVPKDDLDSAAQSVVDLATAPDIGGFLVSSVFDTQEGHGSAHVIVKVPAPRFERVVSSLSDIGEVIRQELEGQDMTPEVLDAHVALQRARARTSQLIRRVRATDDAAARFQLREQLRSAKAALRTKRQDTMFLGSDVAFATVEVALRATPPPPAPGKPVIERALGTAKAVTLAIVSATVLVAGAVLPILGLLVLVYLLAGPIFRRVRPRLHGWPG